MKFGERAFGVETEYSVAIRGGDGKFLTSYPDGLEAEKAISVATVLRDAIYARDNFPENLKALLLYVQQDIPTMDRFWLAANGARFYFDMPGVSPEYATPECRSPREALLYSIAGDTIVEDIRKEAVRQGFLRVRFRGTASDIFVFRMITHFTKNSSWDKAVGCHENYTTLSAFNPRSPNASMERFYRFRNFIVPFLVTRQIFDGSGGIRFTPALGWHYVISQRAFFVNKLSGSDAVQGRGLVHFRADYGDAPSDFSRLHLHCGDAVRSPWGKYLAMAATHFVLRAWEESERRRWPWAFHPHYTLPDFHALASDPTLGTAIRLIRDDKEVCLSAVDVQRVYAEFVSCRLRNLSAEEQKMFNDWTNAIRRIGEDPMNLSREIDWVIKQRYLLERLGGDYSSSKTQLASTFYHELSDRSIYAALLGGGAVKPFAAYEEVARCRTEPPLTRAEFRARYLRMLLEKPDNARRAPQWGSFGAADGSIVEILDPMQRTSEKGEQMLAVFRDMIEGKKRGSQSRR